MQHHYSGHGVISGDSVIFSKWVRHVRFTNFLHKPDNVKHPETSRALPVEKRWGHGTVWTGTAQRNETLE